MPNHKANRTQNHTVNFLLACSRWLITLLLVLTGCNMPGYGTNPPIILKTPDSVSPQTPDEASNPFEIPDGPFVQITSITLDSLGHYLVEYQTFNFTPQVPGTHLHFFFDTVHPDQGGPPGAWIVYGGPSPFIGYFESDRPDGATQLCALVANPDHSMIEESGNCAELP